MFDEPSSYLDVKQRLKARRVPPPPLLLLLLLLLLPPPLTLP